MDKTKYSNSKRKLAAIAMAAVIGVGGVGSAAITMSSPSASSASTSAVVMDVDAATSYNPSMAYPKIQNYYTYRDNPFSDKKHYIRIAVRNGYKGYPIPNGKLTVIVDGKTYYEHPIGDSYVNAYPVDSSKTKTHKITVKFTNGSSFTKIFTTK